MRHLLTILSVLVWTCTVMPAEARVGGDSESALVPPGHPADRVHKLAGALPEHVLFRTAQTVSTGLGGLPAMDARCQAKARSAGLDGTWIALLSDSTSDARDRLAAAGAAGPFFNSYGQDPQLLAFDLDDLFDGDLTASAFFDEFGAGGGSSSASWTATLADGTWAGTSYDDWTSFEGSARVGNQASTGGQWLDWFEASGIASANLYCVRTSLEPAAEPAAPPAIEHTIFVSSTTFDGDFGGLAGADAACQQLADAAGLFDRRWRALLSDSTTDARDRVGLLGPVFDTRGGLVAEDAADLFDGGNATFVRFDELGNLWNGQPVWTGSYPNGTRYPGAGAGGGAFKQNWTSTQGSVMLGGTLRKDAGWLSSNVSFDSGTLFPARLYCVDSIEEALDVPHDPQASPADNGAALVAAVESADPRIPSVVTVAAGTFELRETLDVPSRTTLRGAGEGRLGGDSTLLLAAADKAAPGGTPCFLDANQNALAPVVSIAGAHGVVIEDLRITSGPANSDLRLGIELCGTTDTRVSSCQIDGPLFHGIALHQETRAVIEGNLVQGVQRWGILIAGAEHSSVVENHVLASGGDGIKIAPRPGGNTTGAGVFSDNHVVANYVAGTGRSGISRASDCTPDSDRPCDEFFCGRFANNLFADNVVYDNPFEGIYFKTESDCRNDFPIGDNQLRGNVAIRNGGDGLVLERSEGGAPTLMHDNFLCGNSRTGVFLNSSEDVEVRDNWIEGALPPGSRTVDCGTFQCVDGQQLDPLSIGLGIGQSAPGVTVSDNFWSPGDCWVDGDGSGTPPSACPQASGNSSPTADLREVFLQESLTHSHHFQDPDQDGTPNLFEALWGSDPFVPDAPRFSDFCASRPGVGFPDFPLMVLNVAAADVCPDPGQCPAIRLFDVFQYDTGMVVDDLATDASFEKVFNLQRADELAARLEDCGEECADAGLVVRVPHCAGEVPADLGAAVPFDIPGCKQAPASLDPADRAAFDAYRETWWLPRFESTLRKYSDPNSPLGHRVLGWSVAEERAYGASFGLDQNDWGYPLLARAAETRDREDPRARPILDYIENNFSPGLSLPLQLVYGRVEVCDPAVQSEQPLGSASWDTWPVLDGYPSRVAFDLFPGTSVEAPDGVREPDSGAGSITAGYHLPTCFPVDEAGEPLTLGQHLIVGNYISAVLSRFRISCDPGDAACEICDRCDGAPYGHRNRIWGLHQIESILEGRDATQRLFDANGWELPPQLAIHTLEMTWDCVDPSAPAPAEQWQPWPATREFARHDFWVGLHRARGVYVWNIARRFETAGADPDVGCVDTAQSHHPAWQTEPSVTFPDGPYPVGLHLLKHGEPPTGAAGPFAAVTPLRDVLQHWQRGPQDVLVNWCVPDATGGCDLRQHEPGCTSPWCLTEGPIDPPPGSQGNYGTNRGWVQPYEPLQVTVWQEPEQGDALWIVATNSFAQATHYEIVLPRPFRRFDRPANPELSVDCAPNAAGGTTCAVDFEGIDAHVFYVELEEPAGCELDQEIHHAVPEAGYQALFDQLTGAGYRLAWIDGYDVAGETFFNVVFDRRPSPPWVARHGLDGAEYQEVFDARVAEGFRLVHVDSYVSNGTLRYAPIFVQEGGLDWIAYHGLTVAEHEATSDTLASQGFRPVNLSFEEWNGTIFVTGLWDQRNVGAWEALDDLTAAQYQQAFDRNVAEGRVLAYLNGYQDGGVAKFSAIWNSEPRGLWYARHGLSSSALRDELATRRAACFETRLVTGYQSGSQARFGALWTR